MRKCYCKNLKFQIDGKIMLCALLKGHTEPCVDFHGESGLWVRDGWDEDVLKEEPEVI